MSGPMSSAVKSGACPGRTPIDPSVPGSTTSSTAICTSRFSGVTMSRSIDSGSIFHLRGLLDHLFDAADHVERLLRQVVVLAVDHLAEAAHGLLDRHVLPLETG